MSLAATESQALHEDDTPPEWLAAACTRCGKCCLKPSYMETLYATSGDVARWKKEGRYDILRHSIVTGTSADLWFGIDGKQLTKCPFLKKDRGKPTYQCSIHDTRPEVCRGYPYGYEQMARDGCEIPAAVIAVVRKMK